MLNTFSPTVIVSSDASSTGTAAHFFHKNEQKISCGQFSYQEREKSSALRETKAIEYSLESFKNLPNEEKIWWKTDSAAPTRIVKKGSSKRELQTIAENIFNICKDSKIDLKIEKIPRENLV